MRFAPRRRAPFDPLADRRDADPENPGDAFLVHRQGAFLVGGAEALVGGIGDGAASAVSAVIGLFTVGIRLADMAAGVLRQYYEAERSATDAYLSAIARYYRVIRERAHYVTVPVGSVTSYGIHLMQERQHYYDTDGDADVACDATLDGDAEP